MKFQDEVKLLVEDLQASVKNAPARVKAYVAERSLVITQAIVTNDENLEGIVRQEAANIRGILACEAVDAADSVDAVAIAVIEKAIMVGVYALMGI